MRSRSLDYGLVAEKIPKTTLLKKQNSRFCTVIDFRSLKLSFPPHPMTSATFEMKGSFLAVNHVQTATLVLEFHSSAQISTQHILMAGIFINSCPWGCCHVHDASAVPT